MYGIQPNRSLEMEMELETESSRTPAVSSIEQQRLPHRNGRIILYDYTLTPAL
jgi:hypothetical protein